MSRFATPYPPTREVMIDKDGYVTDRWSAFFDSLFQTKAGIPIGTVWEYAGQEEPVGWLFCNGQSYAVAQYTELYAIIGNSFGGDASNFNVPDKRGRFTFGATVTSEIGAIGGLSEFIITLDYLPNIPLPVTDPSHHHGFNPTPHNHTITDPGHTHTTGTGGGAGALAAGALSGAGITGNSTTGITINDTSATGTISDSATGVSVMLPGGGQALTLLPPYLKMNYIIKY